MPSGTLAGGFVYYQILGQWWQGPVPFIVFGNFPPGNGWTPSATPDDKGWWLEVSNQEFGVGGNYQGAAAIVNGSTPANPRTYDELAPFATGSSGMLGGFPGPCGVWKNHLVYAQGQYTVGTTKPPIRIWDGQFDRAISEAPLTSGNVVPKAVVTMLVANGTTYFTTLDSGTDSTNWVGRVFSLDIITGNVAQIGDAIPTGHVPYALVYHANKLWLGTHRQSTAATGKVLWIRPVADSAWTVDHDLSADSMSSVTSMYSFNGTLLVGCSTTNAGGAKVIARDTSGNWTTSTTGSGGTAKDNNFWPAMATFNGNMYATYWNPDTPAVSKIYKFDGTTWSTVFTATVAANKIPYVGLTTDSGYLLAIGGGLTYDAQLQSTTDGTTWADNSVFLTQGSPNATGLPCFGVVVL